MDNFADNLSRNLDRPVINMTGLDGRFEIRLKWLPDSVAASSSDPSATSLFTAIQEQLGLKLEARKAPLDVLVIDRIEKPIPN